MHGATMKRLNDVKISPDYHVVINNRNWHERESFFVKWSYWVVKYALRTDVHNRWIQLSGNICALLAYYLVWNGNFASTFRGNISAPSPRVKKPFPLCITSLQERRSQPHCGVCLKLRIMRIFPLCLYAQLAILPLSVYVRDPPQKKKSPLPILNLDFSSVSIQYGFVFCNSIFELSENQPKFSVPL
jgi:hypothetical protein